MQTKTQSKDQIFNTAAELSDDGDRAAYLEDACQGDNALRQEIEELLSHDRNDESFLDSPAAAPFAITKIERLTERPGDMIGPFKLLQKIGEGGMGVVYLAEQSQPVTRKVALKIVKPGMDSKEVLARFDAERQALALMDHPNIAKVLDAGTTEQGRPYFVMELVRGIPFTEYCDQKRLTTRERLELFLPICHGVQHAHQKGIIHRDIKPTNILVAQYDNRPVPKIIDFGLAKAFGQKLTQQTMFTQFGQIVGTLEYMSPEQASFNQLDVDTRSDIYSLGVLLYELLAGETPFDKERMNSTAIDELLRIIREEEPPRPSHRLSNHANLPAIAANRRCDPRKLGLMICGELDWIVTKAIEKDRDRRYQSASGLAEDITRYLEQETVLACPPSAGYRFRKFARRNRRLLISASTVVATLLLGLCGTGFALMKAIEAEAQVLKELNAKNSASRREWTSIEVQNFQSQRARILNEKTCELLDRLTSRMIDGVATNNQETVALQSNLLDEVLAFWDVVIAGERDRSGQEGRQLGYYTLQRTLCLARIGAHAEAFNACYELESEPTFESEWWGDLARVCANCAAAVKNDNQLAETYVDRGIKYLEEAADVDPNPPPDASDVELRLLVSHQNFESIRNRWMNNWLKRQHTESRQ